MNLLYSSVWAPISRSSVSRNRYGLSRLLYGANALPKPIRKRKSAGLKRNDGAVGMNLKCHSSEGWISSVFLPTRPP